MVCFPVCEEEGLEVSFPRAVDQRLPKASAEGFGAGGFCYGMVSDVTITNDANMGDRMQGRWEGITRGEGEDVPLRWS
jgi:hypothetical protein